jgi:hypothetical protein
MNKQRLAASLFALCAGALLALPAFAQTSANDTQARNQTTTTTSNPQAAAPIKQKRAVPPLDSRLCLRDTGSHIPPPKGQCLPVAGNSYSQQDIQRTGANNLGQALQMLDPSVTAHGH